ncbi:TPA: hypothetical protein MYM36_005277 [Klebsiella pneumoniae]|mgnify:CR=1|jgi:carbamoyl-phosphate synthetase large chain domain protein (fragment)|nr:hypothetical protein [Klebsiella pneumoniae]HCB1317619.1 hypothetical protein [Klebsiella variicola subsp. variicola]HCC8323789.1 hypothetical protein [Klebsiella pneumoniae]
MRHSEASAFIGNKSILIANRSEIAIRVMGAVSEMDIRTVAIHSREDRLALLHTKAD